MVDFVKKLELNDNNYQTNGTERYESYKKNLLFTMKDYFSFGTYR